MIKQLPEDGIELHATLFGDGAKGMALQVRENEEYGITVSSSRPNRDTDFTHIIVMDGVHGEFESFADLRAEIDRLNSECT